MPGVSARALRHSTWWSALLIGGCSVRADQSMLHPAGPAAAEIAWLWWVMFAAFTAVFVLVVLLLAIAIFRRPADDAVTGAGRDAGLPPPLGRTGFIVAGGFLLPVLVLTPLFLVSLRTSAALRHPKETLTIRVVGRMWWWEVHYPDHGIVTANELYIPAGQPVRLELTSADVIHSFWVPRLHGKMDLIPGMQNALVIQADNPGIYRGQCAEYCGVQHAKMGFLVVAQSPEEFESWLAERTQPHGEPSSDQQQRGRSVFMRAGCPHCHAIQGTAAKGNVGPDLTHLGSRQTIGAALLPNTRGNLAGWIGDPQAIKPGIKMPRTYLEGDDLLALVAYLEELK